jgi:hypothetical protein
VREIYGLDISPDLVSAVTDSVIDEVTASQARAAKLIWLALRHHRELEEATDLMACCQGAAGYRVWCSIGTERVTT